MRHAAGMGVPEPVTVHAPALAGRRLMTQRWRDVAFLHWAVDPEAVSRFASTQPAEPAPTMM